MKKTEIAVISGAIMVMLYCIQHWFFAGLDASASAAWVQGIGSILAVIGAIWIMNKQNENTRKLAIEVEAKNTYRRLNVILALIDDAHRITVKIKTHTEPIDNMWDYLFTVMHHDELMISINTLEKIPLHSIDLPEVAIKTQEIIYFLRKLIPPMEKYDAQNSANYIFEEDEKALVLYCFRNIDEARTSIEETVSQFKADHLDI